MPPMPQRQLPNNRTKPKLAAEPTSMLSLAMNASEIEDELIKICIYGQNRVGKTTLACTFPKPLLLLSFEPNRTGGAQSIKNIPGVKVIRVKVKREKHDPPNTIYGSESVFQLIEDLKNDTIIKSVAIDTVTSYQDLFLQEILGLSSLPEQLAFGSITSDQYRQRSERVKEGLRPFLNLNKHTILLGKEKDHNPPKEEKVSEKTGKIQPDMRPRFLRGMQHESFVATDLGGGAVQWLHDACDYIGRLYVAKEVRSETTKVTIGKETKDVTHEYETGNLVRHLRTLYHPNFAAGFRSSNPSAIPEFIEEPTYEKIKEVIDAGSE